MSLDYIRRYYRVPAVPGARIRYTPLLGEHQTPGTPQYGTIIGSAGSRLTVRLDDRPGTHVFHPTWQIEYGAPAGAEKAE